MLDVLVNRDTIRPSHVFELVSRFASAPLQMQRHLFPRLMEFEAVVPSSVVSFCPAIVPHEFVTRKSRGRCQPWDCEIRLSPTVAYCRLLSPTVTFGDCQKS